MTTEEPISLATANDFSSDTLVPIAGGVLDVNENSRTGLFSTAGITSYTFRGDAGDFIMTSDSSKGDVVFSYNLTPWDSNDDVLTSLANRFIYFTIQNISIVFKCIAPWSTASGSMQFFYNPDPENTLSTDTAVALQQAMRLLQSKQLSSKGEGTVTCNVPAEQASQVFKGMRYCKPATTPFPRAESFGYVGGVVRGVPSFGDGTQWTVTFVVTYVFRDATFNIPTSNFEIVVSDDVKAQSIVSASDGSGYIYIKTQLPTTGRTFAGMFQPYNVKQYIVIIDEDQDSGEISEKYNYVNNSCLCVDDGINLTIWLQTNFRSASSSLNDPETATFMSDLVLLEGSATYSEDALGPSSNKYLYAPKQSNSSFLNAIRSQKVVDKQRMIADFKHVLKVTRRINRNRVQ